MASRHRDSFVRRAWEASARPALSGAAIPLDVVQPTRGATAAITLLLAVLIGHVPTSMLVLTGAYLAIVATFEIVRRRRNRDSVVVGLSTMLVDATYLAAATVVTGGAASPIVVLVYLDVLAVTSLIAPRTGLIVAAWSAVVLVGGQLVVDADLVAAAPSPAPLVNLVLMAAGLLVLAAAAALFSAVNERALRASREQLATLLDLAAEFERASTSDEIGGALASFATDDLGYRRASVVTRADAGWRVTRSVLGEDPPQSLAFAPPNASELEALEALDGSRRVVPHLGDTGFLPAALPDARDVAVVTLTSDDQLLGVVLAERARDRARDDAPSVALGALRQASRRAAQMLRKQGVVAEMSRLATRDPLTGLANRRLFDEELDHELARSRRTGEPLSLVLLDVDRFKIVNDEHGHAAGDRVLKQTAHVLIAHTKGCDLVARVGGDEFAVLLPRCDAEDAAKVAERLRSDPALDTIFDGVPVTLSAGWATWPHHATDSTDLFAAADQALYTAKRTGRARVGTPEPLLDITRPPEARPAGS